jgi:hypothetical protein
MSVDFESVKAKIEEKLPEMLPKSIKWIIVHLLMMLYHFRMPIWVTALKTSKTVNNIKSGSRSNKKTLFRKAYHRATKNFVNIGKFVVTDGMKYIFNSR